MEHKKVKVCRLCLHVIFDENYVNSENRNEMLETVIPKKMNIGGGAICNICNENLVFCYELKNKLLETSICRKGFIKSECSDDNSKNNLKNTKIKLEVNELCCLCLKTCDRSFEMDPVYLKTILNKCFPEFAETQSHLVFCKNCSEHVEKAFILFMACLESDSKIQEFCIMNDKKVNEELNLFEVSQFVLNRKNTDIDLGVLKDASSDNKTIIKEEPYFVGDNNIGEDITERNINEPNTQLDVPLLPIKVKKYKCDLCQYVASYRWQLKRHGLIHLDKSVIPMYSCDVCPFKTKHKYHLNKHSLRHEDPSKIRIFRCELCPYESRFREYFQQHVRKHDEPLFRCGFCPYNTYRKGNYNKHMLIHKNFSEVVAFKCDKCGFKTIHRGSMQRHAKGHQNASDPATIKDLSDTDTYKCNCCSYRSKKKKYLARHMIVHKSSSEIPVYKCEMCSFKTRYKNGIKRHVETHREKVGKEEDVKCESYQYVAEGRLLLNSYTNKQDDSKSDMCK